MKILFPYMARWNAVNWTRYHSLLFALADRGHDVVVLQPPAADLGETNFQEIPAVPHPRIRVVDVHIPGWLWNRKWPLDKIVKRFAYGVRSIRAARQLLKTESFDVILTYNIPQYAFSKLQGAALVFDYADDYVEMLAKELGPLDNPLARRACKSLMERMMRRSRVVTAVSYELAKCAQNVPMEVVPNGVSLNKADTAVARETVEVANHGKPVIGYIGAFEYFINWQCMLDTAARMPDCHFLLVGSGREWQAARDYAASLKLQNVEFTGGVPHSKVFAYIARMDVCLNLFHKIPVSHRACPIKLFEYLSLSKPVVSTRLDELKHVDPGLLMYADDPAETTAAVRQLLASPVEAADRGRRGRTLVQERYTWEAIAQQLERLILDERIAA
jgi:glycosyltransferase involved in cell wall biosynthesis